MPSVARCPYCGGKTAPEKVERLLRGGKDAAVITVPAEVCGKCGQHIYDWETGLKLEKVRKKLAAGQTGDFHPVGQYFRAE